MIRVELMHYKYNNCHKVSKRKQYRSYQCHNFTLLVLTIIIYKMNYTSMDVFKLIRKNNIYIKEWRNTIGT